MLSSINRVYDQTKTSYRLLSEEADEYLPLAPPAAYLLVFLLLPFAYTVSIGFFEYSATKIIRWQFTLNHYQSLLFDPFYRSVLTYTVKLSVIVSVVCILFGYPLGYFIARTTPIRRQLALFSVFLPLMIGTVVRVYGWIVLFATNGVINDFLTAAFGMQLNLLGNTTSVTIGLVGVYLPLVVLPVYSAIEDLDDSLIPAARNLGANRLEAFLKVTLPLSLPGLITGTIFVFVLTMNSIVTPALMGGRTDLTMGLLVYTHAVNSTNWPFASAVGTVLTLATTALVYVYFSLIKGRMGASQ
ncbi:MAG: ABC transporter permease [Halobellus sp.]|uniref:ABC transporter permease n=1 Tax=Halobellus sp. TaxID=1979212 RepID=UPI0035D41F72